jgi:hypothetical protein
MAIGKHEKNKSLPKMRVTKHDYSFKKPVYTYLEMPKMRRTKKTNHKKENVETIVKMKKKPEPILYKPENVKYAHIYPTGFRGGIGKTLCGSTHFGTNPVSPQEYPINQICRRCEHMYEAGEE